LQRQHAQAVNLLTLLVGTPLNNVSLPLPVLLSEQRLPTALTPGLPAETLTARPDVRSAEQQLIAANADIGAARPAFVARISLTTTLGLVSSDLDDLFGNGNLCAATGAADLQGGPQPRQPAGHARDT
jgi:multidrug efflux system outer membrane protein